MTTRTDVKTGWCSFCRDLSHALCASVTCTCPGTAKRHPIRPPKSATPPPRFETFRGPENEASRAAPPQPAQPAKEPKLVWADPPSHRGPANAESPIPEKMLAELRDNPNRWAIVKEFTRPSSGQTMSYRIKAGKWPLLKRGEWESTSRRTPTGGSVVYLRYLGKP